uniref:Putative secreted protein n=1 Tax=Anopheles triannulatus TaxID=58253 RepID=A0A2M4B7F7_9DIPT
MYTIVQLVILIETTWLRPIFLKKSGPNSIGYIGPTSSTCRSVMCDPNFCFSRSNRLHVATMYACMLCSQMQSCGQCVLLLVYALSSSSSSSSSSS